MALFSNLYLFHGSFIEITSVASPWIEGKDDALTTGCADFVMFVLTIDHLCEENDVILRAKRGDKKHGHTELRRLTSANDDLPWYIDSCKYIESSFGEETSMDVE
uniref:Uncharacterized protein n=1 Tax=Cannabis sativa TaxID=3483 RepID=A0A803NTD3_CANSA